MIILCAKTEKRFFLRFSLPFIFCFHSLFSTIHSSFLLIFSVYFFLIFIFLFSLFTSQLFNSNFAFLPFFNLRHLRSCFFPSSFSSRSPGIATIFSISCEYHIAFELYFLKQLPLIQFSSSHIFFISSSLTISISPVHCKILTKSKNCQII